ncbi:CoB--CoM heterodisulfide reductase iron-sulfur subunit A family protein [Dethiosulfatarculus sandiegensis]|uniref:Heterodisulfide reductase n=1 Tax=Dethiosulfatarculus sandiegensis TaxID=1429043 RepID=A0A0D2I060_9BACT|nr:CoB--CoM heterodisulfide reductase iron-sulfur subunit A family protein [Dethiosulfatarculus sandiegensis]KIX15923.1 heterodisulfide reductase [Dethiosulfatarculus sandiegensis]
MLNDLNRQILNDLGDVLVVGGGISGIQAALDLGNAGFKVYLVDKAPTIGGHMAQLDKTFPSNDCSMCIESPKFVECGRHPNIEIMAYTEVEKVEGKAGDFKVTLFRKPRYIIEEKCTGCTVCVEYCPVVYPDQFNQEISDNKAIHVYFAQAIPLKPYIDESCLYLKENKCQLCKAVCQNEAIDFGQTGEKVEVKVGAVILAPGFEPFHQQLGQDYHYGEFENVVTSMDYERLLCATGPYEGEILRASDGKHPHKIAWIQCVGSRRVSKGNNSYCSSVCCTYTQKQVILTKDHDADAGCFIFHNDIRSYGKDFERFFQRTQDLPGVNFIRSYASIVREAPETKNVFVRYATPDQGVKEEEFDMVVLSVGLTPPSDYQKLADIFGIDLNSHGFCRLEPFNPMQTSRPGIFISGAFQGPVDIPESVVTASGAGAQCGQLLSYRRGNLAKKRVYPEERDVSLEEPRIGVYVCHCGANIGRIVDVPSTVEYALSLPNVVHAEENLFICSTEAAAMLARDIEERGLNRVIVAACTPRTHEPLFRDTLREAGINQYYYDMANIREHCSWVHSKDSEAATAKAKDLIRMSVARASFLEPLQEFELPVDKRALVVGGGMAGMTASLSIARQGHEVYLVEKEAELGGMARRITRTLEGNDVQENLRELIRRVHQNPLIHVYTSAVIPKAEGYVGNFTTMVVSQGRTLKIKHGATVIAVGAQVYEPGEYLYGQDERVLTNLEFEEKLAGEDKAVSEAQNVVMIQCVGCRNEDRNYCSRVCCSHSIKNALKLKELNPEANIFILFRDMRTYGFREDYYRLASSQDVKFIRYEPETLPKVEPLEKEGRSVLQVSLPEYLLGQELAIDADLVVLAAAVIPREDAQDISQLFKVSLSADGFFQEAHVKLRPVDFGAEGVYLCGAAHYPKHITETISQAYGAAGRALTLLANDTVVASGSVCAVDEHKCIGCRGCVTACSYGAIEMVKTKRGEKARVIPVLCKGDGLCNAKCPTKAIQLKHYTDQELLGQIRAGLGADSLESGKPETEHAEVA